LVFGCREVSFPPDPGFTCLGCSEDGFDAQAVIVIDEKIQNRVSFGGMRSENILEDAH